MGLPGLMGSVETGKESLDGSPSCSSALGAGSLPAKSGPAPRRPGHSGPAATSPWPLPRAAARATRSPASGTYPETRNLNNNAPPEVWAYRFPACDVSVRMRAGLPHGPLFRSGYAGAVVAPSVRFAVDHHAGMRCGRLVLSPRGLLSRAAVTCRMLSVGENR